MKTYLSDDHVGDLNDGVFVRLGEDTLPAGALDVEAEDPEGRDVRPLVLGRVRDELLPRDVHFDLSPGHETAVGELCVRPAILFSHPVTYAKYKWELGTISQALLLDLVAKRVAVIFHSFILAGKKRGSRSLEKVRTTFFQSPVINGISNSAASN